MIAIHEVAQQLALTEDEVIQQGLRALLMRELGRVELEMARLRGRYDVLQPQQLKQAITENSVASHPAWEDYIFWQNCLETHHTLTELLQQDEQFSPTLSESNHAS